jgi:hypothetical protein
MDSTGTKHNPVVTLPEYGDGSLDSSTMITANLNPWSLMSSVARQSGKVL